MEVVQCNIFWIKMLSLFSIMILSKTRTITSTENGKLKIKWSEIETEYVKFEN